ncbi:MAG: hypothetical protein ACYC3I_22670 [Gemmataceae bacterium]
MSVWPESNVSSTTGLVVTTQLGLTYHDYGGLVQHEWWGFQQATPIVCSTIEVLYRPDLLEPRDMR